MNIDEGNRKNKIGTSDGIYDRKLCGSGGKSGSRDVIVGRRDSPGETGMTPKELNCILSWKRSCSKKSEVSCAVRKYSGDDPDVTNGILVYATVQKVEKKSKINSENSVDLSEKINLDGGIGIGRVTSLDWNRKSVRQQSTKYRGE